LWFWKLSRRVARSARAGSLFALCLLLQATNLGRFSAAAAPTTDFRTALPGYSFHFPADHASHPAFRTEWWYTTGHYWVGTKDPVGDAGRRPADGGFELTFFRSGVARPDPPRPSAWAVRDLLFAHFALTDLRPGGRFHFAEKIGRDALGMAGADSTRYHVWIDDWEARLDPDDSHALRAFAPEHGIELRLVPEKPPAVHGEDGVSRKGPEPGQASHYVSLTRLALTGQVRIGGEALPVYGEAWMDHEFTTGELPAGLVGWDWFGLQLDDGSELMLYRLRRADGTWAPESSGSWIGPDGAVVPLGAAAAAVTSDRTWKSPTSGAVYPARWRVQVQVPAAAAAGAARSYELAIEPKMADQELVTRESTGVTYWEGACRVSGTRDGQPVTGRGYVELTGYAGTFRARM
jgi:predicted secreted hydrolase